MTQRKNILIVDRDNLFLHQLKEQFAPYADRCQAAFATQPAKAVSILERFIVHLLAVNINLGGASGLDLLLLARQEHPDVRVVLFNNSGLHEAYEQTLRSGGAVAVLRKPFHAEELVDLVLGFAKEEVLMPSGEVFRLIDLLQLISLEQSSFRVEVSNLASGASGLIFILQGTLVKAMVNGGLTGVPAVAHMLTWEQTAIVTTRLPPSEITAQRGMPLDTLILRAIVKMDDDRPL